MGAHYGEVEVWEESGWHEGEDGGDEVGEEWRRREGEAARCGMGSRLTVRDKLGQRRVGSSWTLWAKGYWVGIVWAG